VVKVNPLGLASSATLLVLAVAKESPWWELNIGGLAELKLSPFKVSFIAMGSNIVPPIVDYLTLGAWLMILASVALTLIGSFSDRPWSKSLLSFSLSKILGELLAVLSIPLLLYLIMGPLFNTILPFIGGGGLASMEVTERSIPLLAGEGLVKLSITYMDRGASLTIPIEARATPYLAVAIVAVALSIAARLYQTKLVKRG